MVTASDGTTTTTYYYDAGNRRVKKDLETGTDVMYSYDGWQCIEEREYDGADAAWEPRRQHVYGSQYIDEPVLFDIDTGTDGVMDTSRWYLQDTNYNVVALTDDDGDTIERCWFKPYGTTTFTDEDGTNPANQSDYTNTFAFQGRRWDRLDDDFGVYYFRNRHYSPVLGRFMQRDPSGYQDGMNLYEFAMSRPLTYQDAWGLWSWKGIKDDISGAAIEVLGRASDIVMTGKWSPTARESKEGAIRFMRNAEYIYTGLDNPSDEVLEAAWDATYQGTKAGVGCYLNCMCTLHNQAGALLATIASTVGLVSKPFVNKVSKQLVKMGWTKHVVKLIRGKPSSVVRSVSTLFGGPKGGPMARSLSKFADQVKIFNPGKGRTLAERAGAGLKVAVKGGIIAESLLSIYCSVRCGLNAGAF